MCGRMPQPVTEASISINVVETKRLRMSFTLRHLLTTLQSIRHQDPRCQMRELLRAAESGLSSSAGIVQSHRSRPSSG